jgi:4-hydroxybutyrate CoA-transferase
MRCDSAAQALAALPARARVFVHGAAATPDALLAALGPMCEHFSAIELMHLHTHGPAHYADPGHDWVRVTNLFVGANLRKRLDYERVDYLPCFLSEIPALFRSGRRPLDAALLHLSPPDAHGFCTLGTSVDVALAAVESVPLLVAQLNRRMPRVHGAGAIHVSRLTRWIEVDQPLTCAEPSAFGEVHRRIAGHVAPLVKDGATLQMGIGAVPDAVLSALQGHRHLGVHTEMFSDGLLDLIERGAVDNSRKKIFRGQTAASFVMGSQRLYDFVHDNPSVTLHDAAVINDTRVIRKNPDVVALNSAVEIDLTGQVCADSVGTRVISGVGGQMDFIRGASLSPGGRAIIALPSRTESGRARIVAELASGAGVVTTRAHVHFIATEHGVVDLYGKTLGERAKALIALAHPDDREPLAAAWHTRIHR